MTELLTEPIESHDDDFTSTPPPAWPKWIGGLAIAWGALLLTCTGLMTAYIIFLPKLMEQALEGDPMPQAMQPGALDWVLLAVGALLVFVLLFGGIFCVMRNPISRVVILFWGVVTIPLTLVNFVRQQDVQESLQEWAQQYPNNQLAQQLTMGGQTGQQINQIVGLAVTVIIGVLIPAFFIIWFGFIKTKPWQFTGSDDDLL